MQSARLAEVIAQILSSVLQRSIVPGALVVREQEEHWDSLRHMEIIFALESAVGIQLLESEIGDVNNSADLQALAETKIAS